MGVSIYTVRPPNDLRFALKSPISDRPTVVACPAEELAPGFDSLYDVLEPYKTSRKAFRALHVGQVAGVNSWSLGGAGQIDPLQLGSRP